MEIYCLETRSVSLEGCISSAFVDNESEPHFFRITIELVFKSAEGGSECRSGE